VFVVFGVFEVMCCLLDEALLRDGVGWRAWVSVGFLFLLLLLLRVLFFGVSFRSLGRFGW